MKIKIFPTPSSKIDYPECDGIRGAAVLLVFWFHYLTIFKIGLENIQFWDLFRVIAYSGAYGVQLFFVLSAYLLFFPQYSKIQNNDSPQPARQFVIRRFMRIAPLYYLSIVSMMWFVDVGISSSDKFKHTITHLFFIHIFFPETAYSINNVTWSLGVEFLFYLFLPFFIYLISRAENVQAPAIKKKIIVIMFFILFLCVIYINIHATDVIPASITSFFFGLIAALVNFHIKKHNRSDSYLYTILGILVVLAIIAVHYNVYFKSLHAQTSYHQTFVNGVWMISGLYALLLIIAAQKDRLLFPILSFYPLRIIGLVSYEIYLIHFFLLQFIPKLSVFSFQENPNHLINGFIIFCICFLFGLFLHVLISRRFVAVSSFMIRRTPGEKIPGWMSLILILFCILVIVPTILLI